MYVYFSFVCDVPTFEIKFRIRILNEVHICVTLTCKYHFGSKVFYLVIKAISILEESYSKRTQQTGEVDRKKHYKVQLKEMRSLAPG